MSTLKMITFLTHSAFIEKFEHTSYFQLIRDNIDPTSFTGLP